MNHSHPYFIRHRKSTIIILVVIFVVIGALIWSISKNHRSSTTLTAEERASIIRSTTGTGTPPFLTTEESTQIIDTTSGSGSGETSVSDRDKQGLINSMSGN